VKEGGFKDGADRKVVTCFDLGAKLIRDHLKLGARKGFEEDAVAIGRDPIRDILL